MVHGVALIIMTGGTLRLDLKNRPDEYGFGVRGCEAQEYKYITKPAVFSSAHCMSATDQREA